LGREACDAGFDHDVEIEAVLEQGGGGMIPRLLAATDVACGLQAIEVNSDDECRGISAISGMSKGASMK
jgi:hypothetical protein